MPEIKEEKQQLSISSMFGLSDDELHSLSKNLASAIVSKGSIKSIIQYILDIEDDLSEPQKRYIYYSLGRFIGRLHE